MDAADWDRRYASTDLVWSAGPNAFVEHEVGGLAPGCALDLACGEGRNARWLAGRGWRVTAVDFSAVGVEKGRRTAPEVDWQVGDVLTCPLPGGLDLVVVAYLQLTPPERRTALRRCAATLAPGGRLVVVAHDSTNLAEGTGGPQDPAVLYTAQDVLADVADVPGVAWEVVRAERVAREVPAADGHGAPGTAWDALAHLRRRD
ncbi:MAG: Methyltransferase type 12 [Marmoricola sp.]|nr:Methyltransferase type 12 [Marmoricola sp.]